MRLLNWLLWLLRHIVAINWVCCILNLALYLFGSHAWHSLIVGCLNGFVAMTYKKELENE